MIMLETPASGTFMALPGILRNHSTVGAGMDMTSQEKDAVSFPVTNGPREGGLGS